MDQEYLNSVRMDDWDYKNIYEERFSLPLTAKHKLAVGVWNFEDSRGVDLRRFSYNEDRLLGSGITLFQNTFEKIFKIICDINQKNLFENIGSADLYEKGVCIDSVFEVQTKIYDNERDKFFCINLVKNSRPLIFGPVQKAIMIRFNKINDFIIQCRETEIIATDEIAIKSSTTLEKDQRTGRELF